MVRLLSLAEARRIALAAQGFGPQRNSRHSGAKAGWPTMAKALSKLHLLQIDSVNVLVRSHYLPLYSRLGNYDRVELDQRSFTQGKRALFECWAHEASLVPLELHPLMRWRMRRARNGDGIYTQMDRFGREEQAFLDATLAHIKKHGPTRASEVPGGGKALGSWWGWSKGKLALETLFDQGRVTTATRDGFERLYDLPERVIPAAILAQPEPPEHETFARLIEMSSQALGVATEIDLRDYFRLPIAEARQAIAHCVGAGTLQEVAVEGWKQRAYVQPSQRAPQNAGGIALLSPFDPLVWNRSRAERLFSFHYRIELYTPASKRKFGYYVLPFLNGDRLAARLCLKADRHDGVLRVNAAHLEKGEDPQATARSLLPELALMAQWLDLPKFAIAKSGNLAATLRKLS